ncbi:hypothetical protein HK102_005484 [Quaeritorhiza haematococci]|nr:hypothetical protein HK102_005484 [Quaeritorhiza haematococci]
MPQPLISTFSLAFTLVFASIILGISVVETTAINTDGESFLDSGITTLATTSSSTSDISNWKDVWKGTYVVQSADNQICTVQPQEVSDKLKTTSAVNTAINCAKSCASQFTITFDDSNRFIAKDFQYKSNCVCPRELRSVQNTTYTNVGNDPTNSGKYIYTVTAVENALTWSGNSYRQPMLMCSYNGITGGDPAQGVFACTIVTANNTACYGRYVRGAASSNLGGPVSSGVGVIMRLFSPRTLAAFATTVLVTWGI